MVLPEQRSIPGALASRRRISGIFHRNKLTAKRKRGLSMIELLCVIGIIAILLALYLGPISKAFVHVKKVLGN